MKASDELMSLTGITQFQLYRLREMGVVPKPRVINRRGKGHRGTVGVYDDDVVLVLTWVKKELDKGYSLPEIARMWREQKAAEQGVLVAQKKSSWGVSMFKELGKKLEREGREAISAEVELIEEKPDGTIIGKFKVVTMPKEEGGAESKEKR